MFQDKRRINQIFIKISNMADILKLTIEVDKDLINGMLALGGGMKDNTPSSEVKKWIKEHDSVELTSSTINGIPDMGAAVATLALLGISKQMSNDKPTKGEEK